MVLPKSSTLMRSAIGITKFIWCSIKMIVRWKRLRMSTTSRAISSSSVVIMPATGSSSSRIFGLGHQRARHFETTLFAVRQILG